MQSISDTIQTVNALPVMEQFYTIQGEGRYTGYPAYFIRLAGCDVGCVWCDVKESWTTDGYPVVPVELLVKEAKASGAELVVITGGEPAMHQLDTLTVTLQEAGLRTHIETSGTHALSGNWHWVCFSPKKFKQPLASIYPQSHELKVVVYNKHDFDWAEQHAALVNPSCELYLQPEWSKADVMLPQIIDYVKRNPKWRISLQTHKFMQIP